MNAESTNQKIFRDLQVAHILLEQINGDLVGTKAGLRAEDTEYARRSVQKAGTLAEDLLKTIERAISELDKTR